MRGAIEKFSILVPPHLNANDYAAFVMEVLARADPAKAARQKAIEERIATPFSLHETGHAQVDIFQTVTTVLAEEPGLRVAIVYGSAAAGKMRRGSDVDVAVLFGRPLDMDARLALWGKLTDALRREVDLVDLYDLGGEILHQVLTKGRVVVKNDAQAYFRLLQRMVYNAEDFMPQVRQALRRRVERFANG